MLYHTARTGPSVDDFLKAFQKAVHIALSNKSYEVAIAVHTKGNLDGVISEAIGDKAVAALQRPRGYIDYKELRIYMITRLIRSNFRSGVIVAVHASTKYLNKLLSDRRATDLIYVPWAPEELKEYLASHQSHEI